MYQSCPNCFEVNHYQAIFCKSCLEPLRSGREVFGARDVRRLSLLSEQIQHISNDQGECKGEEKKG